MQLLMLFLTLLQEDTNVLFLKLCSYSSSLLCNMYLIKQIANVTETMRIMKLLKRYKISFTCEWLFIEHMHLNCGLTSSVRLYVILDIQRNLPDNFSSKFQKECAMEPIRV